MKFPRPIAFPNRPPVADPLVLLAVCADECRTRGVSFRAWFECVLTALKEPGPPPDSLFPR